MDPGTPDERYGRACKVAERIVNALDGENAPAIRFGRVVFLVLEALKQAETRAFRTEPSNN